MRDTQKCTKTKREVLNKANTRLNDLKKSCTQLRIQSAFAQHKIVSSYIQDEISELEYKIKCIKLVIDSISAAPAGNVDIDLEELDILGF